MKISKLIKILGLSTLMLIPSINKGQKIKKEMIFEKSKFSKYLIDYHTLDANKDGLNDFVVGAYDLNGDNIIDTYASFILYSQDKNTYYTSKTAYTVGLDLNQDGKLDYFLSDEDLNGTLETIKKIKHNKTKSYDL